MKPLARTTLAASLFGLFAGEAAAHFNMLLPQSASARRGEPVTFIYQWGHPFEHQLFDAPEPEGVWVLPPGGRPESVAKSLEKITVITADRKKAAGYRFRFTPDQRGDYIFALTTPPIWMAEDEEFVQDTVQVVLHVQAQKGWDRSMEGGPKSLRMVPLTRPYGLHPGMVFQAQVLTGPQAKPAAGIHVDIERYNPAPPKDVPPDEHITRTVKADPNGVATCTLTERGWWCLTAERDDGTREHNGKPYPLRQRATLWVFVDPKAAAKTDK